MSYAVVLLVALLASGLTLFSGFGLGTVLMPAFALFFPIPVAVAATAVVHLANNLFKVALVGRRADWGVVLRFTAPAAAAAMLGAAMLNLVASIPPLTGYHLAGRALEIAPVKLVIGTLIVGFAALELVPQSARWAFDRRYLILGGLASGFFGGLSGNQGALRSAFLIRAGLDKDAFIGTSTVAAVIVDVARLIVYGLSFYGSQFRLIGPDAAGLVFAATLAAFAGAFWGARLIKKVTLRTVQVVVGAMLAVVGTGMLAGLL